jgi:hypothetical protein
MLGKVEIFLGKSFEKLFPKENPRKILRKITLCRKNVRKIGPRCNCEKIDQNEAQPQLKNDFFHGKKYPKNLALFCN